MFWIYGGSWTSGGAACVPRASHPRAPLQTACIALSLTIPPSHETCSYPLYQGSNFVKQSNVILVAINYRLGAFGWLGHDSLRAADGSTGNWGLQDQRLAMKWVQVSQPCNVIAMSTHDCPRTTSRPLGATRHA
jgi:hypothetical protein